MTSSKIQDTHTTARRLAWLIAGLNITLLLTSVFLWLIILRTLDFGLDDLLQVVLRVFNVVIYSILGLLILSREPRHTIGWLFLILGFFLALSGFPDGYQVQGSPLTSVIVQDLLNWVTEMTWFPWFYISLSLMLLYFPDGHLPSRRWWPVAAAAILALIIAEISNAITPIWESNGEIFPNPFGLPGTEAIFNGLRIILAPLFFIGILGSLAAVIVRFRRSQGVERAQMKWLVYVASVGIITLMLFIAFADEGNPVFGALPILLPALMAITIGIAILRYRLFDIDIIIRRTLVYGLLTGLLALLFYALVTILGSLVSSFGGPNSTAVYVISTLAIAALFTPLRRRIQDLIDRRFYRRKYDAEEALVNFSLTAREEVDLENLSLALLRVVDDTLQPEGVSLWIKQ